mmetsp:Transcript_40171/g.72362  ORF Transcript_40171/g.72362 Transcript_40171/m.72362 type:complete len:233 (-) Transcript_40171:122-820(-)
MNYTIIGVNIYKFISNEKIRFAIDTRRVGVLDFDILAVEGGGSQSTRKICRIDLRAEHVVKKNVLQLGLPNWIKKFGDKFWWQFSEGGVGWGKDGESPVTRQGFVEISSIECGDESTEILRTSCNIIDATRSHFRLAFASTPPLAFAPTLALALTTLISRWNKYGVNDRIGCDVKYATCRSRWWNKYRVNDMNDTIASNNIWNDNIRIVNHNTCIRHYHLDRISIESLNIAT